MFGYVVVNKPELKIREFAVYHSYYCGLCKTLQKTYGIPGRIALSYDMTFLVMLLTGLYEPEERKNPCKCVLHPFEKLQMCQNTMTDYGADMTILLTRHKCLDDWKDEKKMSRGAYAGLLKKSYQKAADRYPKKAQVIEQCMKEIQEAEARGENNIDILSGISGKMMAELFAYAEDEWEEELRTMGFYLGKFVYMMDAYDDLEKDLKSGSFNPFRERCKEEGFEEWVHDILMMTAASCAGAFEKLPVLENIEILRNIIYSGMWTRFAAVSERRKGDERSI